jgi:hypothetical protein
MLKHFMENESINMTAPLYAHTFYRDDKGVVTQHHVTYTKNVDIDFVGDTADGSQRVQYPGLMYDYKEPTKRGLCMMTHVLDQRVPTLGMFHCAGKTGETCSIAGIVSQHQIEEAITALTMKGMVMHSHSSGEFMPDKYGYTYELNVHPRDSHCVNFMTADEEGREPSFEYMGCHTTDTGRLNQTLRKRRFQMTLKISWVSLRCMARLVRNISGSTTREIWLLFLNHELIFRQKFLICVSKII